MLEQDTQMGLVYCKCLVVSVKLIINDTLTGLVQINQNIGQIEIVTWQWC